MFNVDPAQVMIIALVVVAGYMALASLFAMGAKRFDRWQRDRAFRFGEIARRDTPYNVSPLFTLNGWAAMLNPYSHREPHLRAAFRDGFFAKDSRE